MVIFLLSSILFSLSGKSLIMMDISRFIQGIPFVGIWGIMPSICQSFYPTTKVGSKVSQISAYFSFGVFTGPFIGSWLYTLNGDRIVFPFLFLSFGCIIAISLVIMNLPNTCDGQKMTVEQMYHQILLYRERNICISLTGTILNGWSFMYVESIAALYFSSSMNWGPHITAYLFMFSSTGYTIISIVFGKIINEKIGVINGILLSYSMLGFGTFITCVPIQLYLWGILDCNPLQMFFWEAASFLIFGGGAASIIAPAVGLLAEEIEHHELEQSFTYASRSFFMCIGYITSPMIASAFAVTYGYPVSVIVAFVINSFYGIICKIFIKNY